MLFTKTKFLLALTSPSQPQTSPIVTQLDHFLKLSRKKQTIYYKLSDLSTNLTIQKLDLQLHISYIAKDYNLLLFQQGELIKEIDDVPYNRNLFYTLFVRVMEILDQTKHRIKSRQVWNSIDQQKKALTQFYSHQLASGKYEIVPMIRLLTIGANTRIRKVIQEFSQNSNSVKSNKSAVTKSKIVNDQQKQKQKQKPKDKQKQRERQKHLLPLGKSLKQQKQGKWFKQFKQFAVQRSRQFTKQIPRSSDDFSLSSKTIELSFRPKKHQQNLSKSKVKVNFHKTFNKLYKPIQVKVDIIQQKKQTVRLTLERLMQRNKQIEKQIGNYSACFDDKKKGKQKQFRIKVKSIGCVQ